MRVVKNAPLPEARGGMVRTGLIPKLRQLEVGDALLIPKASTTRNRLASAVSYLQKDAYAPHKRFSIRTLETEFGVWRTQ